MNVSELFLCPCGHDISDEHSSLGCYAHISYRPLVGCNCDRTDEEEADVIRANVQSLIDKAEAEGATKGLLWAAADMRNGRLGQSVAECAANLVARADRWGQS